jgi:mono/diheme cytochrome c family protein
MKSWPLIFGSLALAAGAFMLPGIVRAQQGTGQEATKVASANDPAPAPTSTGATTSASPAAPSKEEDEDALRLDGERRFRANCGRCHQAPHKLPPRMMATIVRHMRVRATITDEDMRVILHYMTQ